MDKKNVVVLGAGFGGLRAARNIAKELQSSHLLEKYDVVLIDRNDYQIYTPELFAYAAAPKESALPENVHWNVAELLRGRKVRFIKDEVASIDLAAGDIHLASGTQLKSEFVVIALGSVPNFFGIPGMQENVISLKTFNDAEIIRKKIQTALSANPNASIVVGGAGPNGIELASEIKYLHPQASVTIIEAMPTIVPGFQPKTMAKISKRLEKLGAKVMVNSKITKVDAKAVSLDGGTSVPFDVMIWTGGIKAPDMVSKLPLKADRGKPLAETHMECLPQSPDLKLYPMVYVLGDSVCFQDPKTGHPMPAVAPVAMDQGEIVAKNIVEEIKGKEIPGYKALAKHYDPKDYPYVIPVGGTYAVAKIGDFIFGGWPAWMFKEIIILNYLISVMPFFSAIGAWLK